MNPSELVYYRNHVRDWHPDPACWAARSHLQNLIEYVKTHPMQLGNNAEQLSAHLARITQGVNDYFDTIKNIQRQLESVIAEHEKVLYAASDEAWRLLPLTENTEKILTRRLAHESEDLEALMSVIKTAADWRCPGLVLRPSRETFVQDLVALDPLYLVDIRLDLLEPARMCFNEQYQRRLRFYEHDPNQSNMLNHLPQAQMGLIFAWNYLNYCPLTVIYQYLESFWHLLRPGGVAVFTFNDCDHGHGVGLAEQHFMSYTPGHLVANRARELGFEIMQHVTARGDLTWMTIRQPGGIVSLRGGQTLAKLVARSK
jgi:SAM-dependent methyltransferase